MQGCCYRDGIDAIVGWKLIHMMKMCSCKVRFDMPLDVLIDEHENVEILFWYNVKSIVAYVEVGESRNFQSTLVSE